MQALRLTRNATVVKPVLSLVQRRCLATATANQVHLSSTTSSSSATGALSGARVANIPLSNIEAHWQRLSGEEKISVHEQLEALQLKDWKELSLDEKRAGKGFSNDFLPTFAQTFCIRTALTYNFLLIAYYVAFGPHGPRAPTSQPGDTVKIIFSTLALIAAGGALFFTIKAFSAYFKKFLKATFGMISCVCSLSGPAPPRTMTKEWQEASNERAKEMKLNPISGQFHRFVFELSLLPLQKHLSIFPLVRRRLT